MGNKTIGELTLATSALGSDWIEFEVASSGVSRRITKDNFIGATLTGGGMIATGGNTLSVPASGTASLLGVAQTYSAAKTFTAAIAANAGISFGQSTLNFFEEDNWSPTLTFGGGNTGMSIQSVGRYVRIGSMVQAWGRIRVSAVGSSTGAASVGGLPFISSDITSPTVLFYPVVWYTENITFTGWLESALPNNATSFLLVQNNDGTISTLTDTAFGTGDIIYFSVNYRTG